MLRQMVYGAASFCAFGYYKRKHTYSDEDLTGFKKFRVGAATATVTVLAGAPLDVIKTRIQANHNGYHSFFQTLFKIRNEEGTQALYKGAATKIVKLSLGTLVFMLCYEALTK